MTGEGTKAGETAKRPSKKNSKSTLPMLGWREWVDLPDWGASFIKAKIDTGARTSALHVEDIDLFTRRSVPFIRFAIPRSHEHGLVQVEAPLEGKRSIKSSIGEIEHRYIVTTGLRIGSYEWPVEISLTDRTHMEFPMLIGRTAIRRRFIINPGRSCLLSKAPIKRRG